MSAHSLADMVELDLGHGKGSLGDHVAVCACGWRSTPQPDHRSAMDRLTEHASTASD